MRLIVNNLDNQKDSKSGDFSSFFFSNVYANTLPLWDWLMMCGLLISSALENNWFSAFLQYDEFYFQMIKTVSKKKMIS